MTAKTKDEIKEFFETGDKPTQSQFVDFIDSYVDKSGPIGEIETQASGGTTGFAFASAGNGSIKNAVDARNFMGITVYTTAQVAAVIDVSAGAQAVVDANYATTAQATAGTTAVGIMSPVLTKKAIEGSNISTGWTRIETVTAVATAQMAFTSAIDSTYSEYQIKIVGLMPSVDGARLEMLTAASGSDFDGGSSDYAYAMSHHRAAGSKTNAQSVAASAIKLSVTNLGGGTNETSDFVVTVFEPAMTNFTLAKWWGVGVDTGGLPINFDGGGQRLAAAAVVGFSFRMDSGDLSCVGTLYGR